MKILNKKVIPILLALLTLLALLITISSSTLADDKNMSPSSGSGQSFDQMKARMTESVNITIDNLESSEANMDKESSIQAAEKLITDLKSIKEELSNAKTEDDLIKIKQELDTLFNAAPEELKNIAGLIPQNMGPRPDMQNVSENFSQDFKNRSEMRPEMMNNRSQPPEMMNNRSQSGGLNATMNDSERPGPRHTGMEGKNNSADIKAERGNETTADSGFLGNLFGGLINTIKSLFPSLKLLANLKSFSNLEY
jgi:hypothetical protein